MSSFAASATASGLSPQARGNRDPLGPADENHGSIPAGAGEPSRGRPRVPCAGVYPRRRGGTSAMKSLRSSGQGLSPQARGNHRHNRPGLNRRGSIPAGAGEPSGAVRLAEVQGVYPRRRGGTGSWIGRGRHRQGLSPQARGNHAGDVLEPGRLGSIPAGAGEPQPRPSLTTGIRVYPRRRGGTPLPCVPSTP